MNITQDYTLKKIQKERPVKQLQVSYDELYRQHTKLEEKLLKAMKENKDIKAKSDQLERELSKKQRTIESLVDEKTDLQRTLNENKAKNRKLESKIVIGGIPGEAGKKQVIASLKSDKQALESELDEAYSKLQELEDHIQVISRALEIKADSLKLDPIFLLRIGESRESSEKLKEKEKILRVKIQENQEKCEDLQKSNELFMKENEYLANAKKELEARTEKLENANKALKAKLDAVTEEHKSLLEYIDELSSQKSSVSIVHKQTKQSLEAKKLQYEELQMKYLQLESQVNSEKVQKSVKFSLSEDDQSLKTLLETKEAEILSLKMRIHDLESSQINNEKSDQYEKALLDLEELKDEKEQLKQAMNEAINQCAISLVKQQALEKENQKLQKQVENQANSKLLMQATLADQINSLRSQVQKLKEEKAEQGLRLST